VSNINTVVEKVLSNKLYNIAVSKYCWRSSRRVSCMLLLSANTFWL